MNIGAKKELVHATIIGERERANLVVQLARFFYIYISISTGADSNVNVILQCWMQCACAVVARHVRALHLYYSWRCAYYSWQLCLFVGFHKQPVYTSSCISLLSTPLSFFAVYYLDRSRSPTMFNILLVIGHQC